MDLFDVLTDRVASARRLSSVLAWRLWRLVRQPGTEVTSKALAVPLDQVDHTADHHLATVRTLGGPAAARAALTTACPYPAR